MIRLTAPLLLLVLLVTSCGKPKPSLTDKDYRVFADRLDSALRKGDISFMKKSIDYDALVDSLNKREEHTPLDHGKLRRSFEDATDALIRDLALNGLDSNITLLGVRSRNGNTHAIYRIYNSTGFNYFDCTLGEKNKQPVITELFLVSRCVAISEYAGSPIKTKDPEKTTAEVQTLLSAEDLVSKGQPAEAKKLVVSVSPEMQNCRFALGLMVRICAADSSDNEFKTVSDHYRMSYPGDASLPLHEIDGYYVRRDLGHALQSINAADSILHDPGLELLRASVYYMNGSIEQSLNSFRKAGEVNTPGIRLNAWRSVINILVSENRFDDALATCKMLVQKKIYTKAEIADRVLQGQILFSTLPDVNEWLNEST